MKTALKTFAFKASLTLNAVVLLAGLIGFAAVHSNAAEGYVKLSTSFGSPTVDKVEIAQANPEVAMQAMPLPARKPVHP
jgi:hypothetical protein